ncbi:hypothetical protein RB195_010744 [Necator americanus]|uniref:Helicase C-terminal domain-containing protein n=1 Tax=Necator americanus TaxID=51031 RepID=A0ABR1D0K0_NECAM
MSGSGHPFPIWTPPEIISTYSEKGINCLFDWQTEVLDWAEESDDNIVYCAPTSAGKSLVAELIALRVALTGKRVLFLLPYISVAKEKLRFLQVFETQFRPVQLHERICCEGHISDLSSGHIIRDVPRRFRTLEDPECVLGLAAEGIFLRKLVLVFSSSKADVEKIALDLAKILDGIYRSNHVIASRVDRSALSAIQSNIQKATGTVDAVLLKTLPRGVAFHHAGLTSEERECIEQGFRDGTIMVLVATSTLSSGVNLPAGRVVIKSQVRGPAAINATTYKQMSGRAGRLGQVEIVETVCTNFLAAVRISAVLQQYFWGAVLACRIGYIFLES